MWKIRRAVLDVPGNQKSLPDIANPKAASTRAFSLRREIDVGWHRSVLVNGAVDRRGMNFPDSYVWTPLGAHRGRKGEHGLQCKRHSHLYLRWHEINSAKLTQLWRGSFQCKLASARSAVTKQSRVS